jgi:tetratricopeptide (TPR) repeat protein
MGPINHINRKATLNLSSNHVSNKTKVPEASDREHILLLKDTEAILPAAKNTPEIKRSTHIPSRKSVASFPNESGFVHAIKQEDEDSVSSTTAVASPPRSKKQLQKIVNYTNQGCQAFESRQYDLAVHFFCGAHSLLHLHREKDDNELLLLSSVSTDFKSTNSYIYQRVEFDEGMYTFSQPFKIHVNDEAIIDSTIWLNKGHVYMHHRSWEKAINCFQSAIDVGGASKQDYVYVAALQSIGQVQYRLGKYDEALSSYMGAVNSAKSIFRGEKHEAIGAALNSLSVLYYHLSSSSPSSGNDILSSGGTKNEAKEYFARAKYYAKKSLSMRLSLLKDHHQDIATTYNNIGRLYVMEGRFKEALNCYEKALTIRADKLGKGSLDYAATAFNAGQSYHHIKDLATALRYYQEFLAVAVKRFSKNHRDVAVVLSGIAEIHQERGEMDDALRLYEESLEAGKRALGENHPEIAMILNRLGNFHYVNHNYDAAFDVYSQGLAIERKGSDDTNGIVSLCNLGEIHRQRKEWDAAIKTFRQVLRIQRKKAGKGNQNADIATTLHVIGLSYERKGDAEAALRYLQEALLMRRFVLGEDHIDVTPTLTTIGIMFSRTNKFSLGLDLLQESLRIRIAKLGNENRDVAFTMYNIALIYQKTGSLTEAISCLTEVLRIERALLGEDHKDVAITLFKLGETFKKHNDQDRALLYFKEALKVERKVMLEKDPLTVARTLQEIGNIHLFQGNTEEMMNVFVEAARIYQSSSISPDNVVVENQLYAIDLSCPRAAPAA